LGELEGRAQFDRGIEQQFEAFPILPESAVHPVEVPALELLLCLLEGTHGGLVLPAHVALPGLRVSSFECWLELSRQKRLFSDQRAGVLGLLELDERFLELAFGQAALALGVLQAAPDVLVCEARILGLAQLELAQDRFDLAPGLLGVALGELGVALGELAVALGELAVALGLLLHSLGELAQHLRFVVLLLGDGRAEDAIQRGDHALTPGRL